jgi:hypothetical protein
MDLFAQTDREVAVDLLHDLTAIYTNEPIVDELLDSLDWPKSNNRLLDPSVGAGVFICRALERLLLAQPDINDARLVHVLQGWEIHPFAVSQARAQIARMLCRRGRTLDHATQLAQLIVHEGDFLLDAGAGEKFSAVATNPPYLRMANVPEIIRADYLDAMPDYAAGDMLHSFLDRSARMLTPDGEIAMITSDRVWINETAGPLRAAIGVTLGLAHIERVDAGSAFHRPKQRKQGTPPRVHPVLVVLKPKGLDGVRELTAEPIYPGEEELEPYNGPTLGDVARVRVAPWLGTPGIFIVDQAQAAGFPAHELVPAVDTDDIAADDTLKAPRRFALRTQLEHEPSAAVLAHLDANLHRMCERGRRATRWVPPESFESWDLTTEYLIVPRIARRLRPVRVPAGVLATNHNLAVISAGSMSLDEIAAALRSERAQEWIRVKAPRVDGGFYSLNPRFLCRLPIA